MYIFDRLKGIPDDGKTNIELKLDNISVTIKEIKDHQVVLAEIKRIDYSSTSLISRLKAERCEWCGAENVPIEMHHVRKIKDLKGKAGWEIVMIGRKRKTMALCHACHDKLHAGKLD